LYSYSLLFFGADALEGLRRLRELYLALLARNLLLSGAMVPGMLDADLRFAERDFHGSVRARGLIRQAVGLLDDCQGARLLVDAAVAGSLLPPDTNWGTPEGYLREREQHPEIPDDDPRRFLVARPDGASHEFLYFYREGRHPATAAGEVTRRLRQANDRVAASIREHYSATTLLIDRSCERIAGRSVTRPKPV
jgi:hypothetical protein